MHETTKISSGRRTGLQIVQELSPHFDFKKIVPLTIAMVEEIYKLGFRRQISLVESFSGIY